jgi:hypothetical protein|tara:strand:+ start:412 stop:1104 length:693 start_codon:yes stop_codon:yes gene_type:complete
MATTATTIITEVRTLSDTDSATSTLSDSQILRAINASHEHYYDIIVASDEGHFEQIHTASLVANSRNLNPAVTSTFRKIDLVEVIQGDGDRQPVVPLSAKTEKFYFEDGSMTATRDDQFYYYIEGNAVQLVPSPTEAATDAIEVTFVPEATRISTTTTTIDCPDRWAKVIALRALLNLQLRLQDGRDPKEELVSEEMILTATLEGRQRQAPRRIVPTDDEGYTVDGIWVG